uniref:Uncharacterized protein n=1 Tax=Siphoviridae sp. ctNDP2 TaxID=2826265 RepID=A0A8S5NFN2_9CAUD|nr:MAG TPA: hypothetical protein [Siphoviridae sp. ctNDP2]
MRTFDSTLSVISQLDGFLHAICRKLASEGRMQAWREGKAIPLRFSASVISTLMMFLMYAIFLSCLVISMFSALFGVVCRSGKNIVNLY